jgi:hypothetical protein
MEWLLRQTAPTAYPCAKESSCEPQNYVSWLPNPLTHSQSLRIPDVAALLVSLAARFKPLRFLIKLFGGHVAVA